MEDGEEKGTVRYVEGSSECTKHSGGEGYGYQNFRLNKIAIFLKPGREELTGQIATSGEKGFRKEKEHTKYFVFQMNLNILIITM